MLLNNAHHAAAPGEGEASAPRSDGHDQRFGPSGEGEALDGATRWSWWEAVDAWYLQRETSSLPTYWSEST